MKKLKNICIFLFSGTGMTKYVIEKIKTELETRQICVNIYCIENVKIDTVPFDSYDAIGFAYPVHSFNAPKIMIDFAKKLPNVKCTDTFVVSTAGGYSSSNFSSSKLLIKILRKKGFNVFYDKQFIMPSNFAVKDDETVVKNKFAKVNEEIPETVQEITNMISHEPKSNFVSNIVAFIGRVEWLGLLITGRFFHANKECNSCKKCVDSCPNRSITLKNEKAHFNRNCGLCMRCVYLCPQHCIKPYRIFKFISFDKWYETGNN